MTKLFRLLPLLLLATLISCAKPSAENQEPTSTPAALTHPEEVFIVSRATTRTAATPVVVLLPGASGLKIFDDTQHYHRTAARLNEAGYDTIIVDYKAYAKATKINNSIPGRPAALATGDALRWARQSGLVDMDGPSGVIAWSLGAQGVWYIAGAQGMAGSFGVDAAALFYPVIPDEYRSLLTSFPILILAGEADDVCPAEDIRKYAAANDTVNGKPVTLHVYPDAHHGFDVSTIAKRRRISLIPLIGPSATFQYNQQASERAWAELLAFLQQHLNPPSR
ncbi:MAG: dienelactone hydrolase family protein [Phycisphaerales bacterium]